MRCGAVRCAELMHNAALSTTYMPHPPHARPTHHLPTTPTSCPTYPPHTCRTHLMPDLPTTYPPHPPRALPTHHIHATPTSCPTYPPHARCKCILCPCHQPGWGSMPSSRLGLSAIIHAGVSAIIQVGVQCHHPCWVSVQSSMLGFNVIIQAGPPDWLPRLPHLTV